MRPRCVTSKHTRKSNLALLGLNAPPRTQEITLAEALTGTSFSIHHLDKRVLLVESPAGEVIKPDAWRCINDEGMPFHGRPFEKGNLYVKFTVKFPDSLHSEQLAGLKRLLPAPRPDANGRMDTDEDTEQVGAAAVCRQAGCKSCMAWCL